MNSKKIISFILSLVQLTVLLNSGCGDRISRQIYKPEQIPKLSNLKEKPFVKLHLKDGGVYILKQWTSDSSSIKGNGFLLNALRDTVSSGNFEVPLTDFVLAESNIISDKQGQAALWILTGISVAATIYCISNPKACFGSCPTFYAFEGEKMILQAESFSSSVMPVLETNDIDALYNIKPQNRFLELRMKNEALETHSIRNADLLALQKPIGGRVLAAPVNEFYEVTNFKQPIKAVASEGDISEKICSFDGNERFSTADSNNLSEKEVIELTFRNNQTSNKGLVVAFRQTLLTTFLFYQSLAYMGNSVGHYFAEVERNKNYFKSKLKSPGELLGGIEVFYQDTNATWLKAGEFNETGPIASNIQVLPINSIKGDLNIQLRMAKGMWRLDYASMVDIGDEVNPLRIQPKSSLPSELADQNVITSLSDPEKVLVTYPGDQVSLQYELPDNYADYDYFLDAQGYYLEWIRDEWTVEENKDKVSELIFNPNKYLKDLAPQFKKIEADMEESFWRSKYVLP